MVYKQQYSFIDSFLQLTTPHDFNMGNVSGECRLKGILGNYNNAIIYDVRGGKSNV